MGKRAKKRERERVKENKKQTRKKTSTTVTLTLMSCDPRDTRSTALLTSVSLSLSLFSLFCPLAMLAKVTESNRAAGNSRGAVPSLSLV